MALMIDGDELDMSPRFWIKFANWWGDKAYREAWMAQELEVIAREEAAEGVKEKFEWLGDNSGDQYDLGYARAIRDVLEYLGEAPRSSDLLVWTGGELVNDEGNEYDDA